MPGLVTFHTFQFLSAGLLSPGTAIIIITIIIIIIIIIVIIIIIIIFIIIIIIVIIIVIIIIITIIIIIIIVIIIIKWWYIDPAKPRTEFQDSVFQSQIKLTRISEIFHLSYFM